MSFLFHHAPTTPNHPPSLHDALPISFDRYPRRPHSATGAAGARGRGECPGLSYGRGHPGAADSRSEEHTSELQSRGQLVCRLLHEKKKYGSRITLSNILLSSITT